MATVLLLASMNADQAAPRPSWKTIARLSEALLQGSSGQIAFAASLATTVLLMQASNKYLQIAEGSLLHDTAICYIALHDKLKRDRIGILSIV